MNCLDYRRTILVDPNNSDTGLLAHMRDCTACASFQHDQLAFEGQLRDTMNVEVPEGLAARILLRQSTGIIQEKRRQHRLYAVAASFVLAIGIVIGVQLNQFTQPLDQLVLAHVNDEPQHLQDRLNIGYTKVQAAFNVLDMTVSGSLGTVNFISNCNIRKEQGVHIVLQGKYGPVTVLVMPSENLATRRVISDQRFHGIIIPTERGSFAIVGEHKEVLEPYVEQLGRLIKM